MNLDTCTPGQRHVVTTLDAPLVVAAGAGSGKTFTLTQRIAWALLPGADGSLPFAGGVDEVLAITYTNKAAAELRSRVKQQLIDEGMMEEALKADDAWISTIHGMCSRLLREHALEFGIDPAFELVIGADADRLFDQALREVYSEAMEEDDASLARYLSGRTLRTAGPGGSSVASDVQLVIDCVRALPGGFDAYLKPASNTSCRAILQQLFDLGQGFQAHAAGWKKPRKTDQKHVDALEVALPLLEEALSGPIPNFEDDDFDPDAFLGLVFCLPPTSEKYRVGKDDEDFFRDYRRTYAELGLEAQVLAFQPERNALVRFAQRVASRYSQIKGPSRLDNDDLISIAAHQLELHPELAQACRDQFKLVMVDEFQDTNRVQVGLVRKIADPACSNVCMVGDAQQSIYKFRGADVSVFFDFQEEVARLNERAEVVKLPDNFRSHADVLSVVDRIFSSDSFFGERFLHLEPKGQVNGLSDPLFKERPRIEFFVAQSKSGLDEARVEAARAVARHFAELREEGTDPGDMVLLLGAMSKASVYVDALSEEGFQSIIAGGSVFARAPEVSVVANLLRWWSNPLDSESLLCLLASMPFVLDEDTLLALRRDDGGATRDLSKGFRSARDVCPSGLDSDQSRRLVHVASVLWESFFHAQSSCSDALRQLFVDSGWAHILEGQGAKGLACAGNVLKAADIIRSLEEGLCVAEVSSAFEEHLVSAKEAPGSLTTTSSQFVRIMTVHASKGLQFPHVALAELRMGNVRGFEGVQKLGDSFVCMKRRSPSFSDQKKTADKLYSWSKTDPDLAEPDPASPGGLYRLADRANADEEREEAQRLLYVGMTRPSKSLFVSFCVKGSSGSLNPLYADVREVIGWEEDPALPLQMIDYGGSCPARVAYVDMDSKGEDDEVIASDHSDPAAVLGFEGSRVACVPRRLPGAEEERSLWSYSSLSQGAHSPAVIPGAYDKVDASEQGTEIEKASSVSVEAQPSPHDESAAFDSSGNGAPLHHATDEDALSVDLGSAFHLLAERSIRLFGKDKASRLQAPSQEEVKRVSNLFSLSQSQRMRLQAALDRWFDSKVAGALSSCDRVYAEVPFVVRVPDGEGSSFVLEGEIDALGLNDGSGHAFLIDYKTGGSPAETEESLHEKHLLQAQCYSFDLLSSGFESVDAYFVRVERPSGDDPSQPEVVRYSFNIEDRDALAQAIACCSRS